MPGKNLPVIYFAGWVGNLGKPQTGNQRLLDWFGLGGAWYVRVARGRPWGHFTSYLLCEVCPGAGGAYLHIHNYLCRQQLKTQAKHFLTRGPSKIA